MNRSLHGNMKSEVVVCHCTKNHLQLNFHAKTSSAQNVTPTFPFSEETMLKYEKAKYQPFFIPLHFELYNGAMQIRFILLLSGFCNHLNALLDYENAFL